MRRVIASRPLLPWILLVAVVCRGLIPAGFMPAFDGAHGKVGLAFCSGGTLVHADPAAGGGTPSMDECPYAAAAVPAMPAIATAFVPEEPDASRAWTAVATYPPSRTARSQPPARGPPATI